MRITFWPATTALAATVSLLAYLGLQLPVSNAQAKQETPVEAPEPDIPKELTDCPTQLDTLPEGYTSEERMSAERLIVVFKRSYKVGLYHHGKLVDEQGEPACFPISMGDWPFDPKTQLDYMSTPEGWYALGAKATSDPNDGYDNSSYEHALFVNYPNAADVARALEREIITPQVANELYASIHAGEIPQQDTPMGGAILLHSWFANVANATAGCVGVDDSNMQWLFEQVEVGDPILLLPWRQVRYADGTFAWDDSVQKSLQEPFSMDLIDPEASTAERIVFKPVYITAN